MCFNNSWNHCSVLSSLLLIVWLLFVINSPTSVVVRCDVFTIGYLPKLHNYGGDSVSKPKGLVISGAIKYAIEKVNNNSQHYLKGNHTLELMWNKTDNDDRQNTNSGQKILIRALTGQWRDGAIAFFGPEDTCYVEAHIAAAWNLPMISYVSLKKILLSFTKPKK